MNAYQITGEIHQIREILSETHGANFAAQFILIRLTTILELIEQGVAVSAIVPYILDETHDLKQIAREMARTNKLYP